MTVAADHRAVEADVAGRIRGAEIQLRTEEIALFDPETVVENLHHIQRDQVFFVAVVIRTGADQNIQILAGKHFCDCLGRCLSVKMRQQIGDQEALILGVVADTDIDGAAVELHHPAVQSERNGRPLVFLDAAVIVGLEQRKPVVLIQRIGF